MGMGYRLWIELLVGHNYEDILRKAPSVTG
jgi:hypothetical protein